MHTEKGTTDLQNYLEYVQKVLGVRSVVLSASSEPDLVCDLWIQIQDFGSYVEAEKDLLQKMISAMKLEAYTIQITDLNVTERISALMTLRFVDQPEGADETFSARVLLLKPELKKKTWADLQDVVKRLAAYKN